MATGGCFDKGVGAFSKSRYRADEFKELSMLPELWGCGEAGSEERPQVSPVMVLRGPVRGLTTSALVLVLSTAGYVHSLGVGFQSPADALGLLV